MSEVLPFIIVGLVSGSLYGLAAVGLVLTYRTSGVFNFGHGAIAAAGAFLFYELTDEHGMAWPLAAIITLLVFGVLLGLIIEAITRAMSDVPAVVIVVLTVGVFLAVNGAIYLRFGTITRSVATFLPTSGYDVSTVTISWAQTITALVSLGLATLLYLFMRLTKLGISMRAVVDDATLVALTGVRATTVRRIAWSIGCCFAAMTGVLIAPTLGLDPTLLTLLVVQAFGACAVGRFSSLPLTFAGGLGIGVLASLATKYFTAQPWDGIPPTVPFIVLVGVLLAVPARKLPASRVSLRGYIAAKSTMPSRVRIPLALAGGVALILVPWFVGTDLPVWINALSYSILLGSLSLLVWTSGQISLCHMAFAAIGATTMAHLSEAGVPWLVAVLLAGLCVVPAGALVAVPAIRLSGIYLALATLGFGVFMQYVAFRTDLMFGSSLIAHAPRPELGFVHGDSDRWLYYVALAFAAAAGGLLLAVQRGRLGRLLQGLASTPTMLQTAGLTTGLTRLLVLCVSTFLAGIAGALMITQYGAVSGQTYGPVQSLLLVGVLGMCGTRPLRSAIIAAGLVSVLPGYVDDFDANYQLLFFGLGAVVAGIVLANRSRIMIAAERSAADTEARVGRGRVAARLPVAEPV